MVHDWDALDSLSVLVARSRQPDSCLWIFRAVAVTPGMKHCDYPRLSGFALRNSRFRDFFPGRHHVKEHKGLVGMLLRCLHEPILISHRLATMAFSDIEHRPRAARVQSSLNPRLRLDLLQEVVYPADGP